MFPSRLVVREAGYAVACILAAVTLVVSGFAHQVLGKVAATGNGIAINGSPSVGAMNILVMGLESRTNYWGQTLSVNQLNETHSGNVRSVSSGQVGAQDTNTLILIHIFAGGQKAVGFSIPRDDLVTYPAPTYLGITEGKIDQAYDFAYNQSLGQTVGSSMTRKQRYLAANHAGQAFEIATVQAVTGVKIDHFIELNLIGFYYLAAAFGGLEACVKPYPGNHGANLYDAASGWNAVTDGYNLRQGGAQYLHLRAGQALAFVRARDSLPGIDLGRTKRQQAVIDYAVWKVKTSGALSDLGLLNRLLSTASQYLVTDSTFDPLDFATNMRALTGSHMSFQTLPISGQVNEMPLNGSKQDVNLINVPYLQAYVHNAFYPPPVRKGRKGGPNPDTSPAPAPSTVTVDVYNGSGANGLAGGVSQALGALGYQAGTVANASTQAQPVKPGTQVFYGAGTSANAAKIAARFGVTATALTSLPAGQVEVLLGSAVTTVPASLAAPSDTPSSTSATDGAPAAGGPSAGAQPAAAAGGTVTVAANAKYGIPCVY